MGTGIVFVYLLIAALVAPIVWVMWWAADSLGTARPHLAAIPATPAARPRREAFPKAVDLRLPTLGGGKVTIYNFAGRQVDACSGPDASGKCPRPNEDGVVPCSGCLLALPRPIRGSFEWQIPANYHTCLLGSYAAFRQKP